MDRVLVPMDDSPPAWNALEYVLSGEEDAALTVLHVVDVAAQFGDSIGMGAVMVEGRQERATDLLADVTDTAAAADCEVDTVVEEGRPARVIVEYARDHAIDRVVIGSHGRTGVSRVLFGSVAEAVVRRSPVPVTVVP